MIGVISAPAPEKAAAKTISPEVQREKKNLQRKNPLKSVSETLEQAMTITSGSGLKFPKIKKTKPITKEMEKRL